MNKTANHGVTTSTYLRAPAAEMNSVAITKETKIIIHLLSPSTLVFNRTREITRNTRKKAIIGAK